MHLVFAKKPVKRRSPRGLQVGIAVSSNNRVPKREAQEMWKRTESPAINTVRIGVLKEKELNE